MRSYLLPYRQTHVGSARGLHHASAAKAASRNASMDVVADPKEEVRLARRREACR
jgi:hypothetical protein